MEKYQMLALLSTIIVSLISLIGIIFISLTEDKIKSIVFILVSFAVGALIGTSFLHLIPESYEAFSNSKVPSILICLGIILFFIAERLLNWHHHKVEVSKIKPFGKINLLIDGLHNFTDGILIAAAWMTNPATGIATTIAVITHEIPHEIGNFGILVHAGYTKTRALMWNFVSAITAIIGTLITLWIGNRVVAIISYIIPFAAGGFIYLACSDLIPELNKQNSKKTILLQVFMVITGILLMYWLLTSSPHEAHVH
jgi:zinc and cadmium transporter